MKHCTTILLLCLLSACASIPPAANELSAVLGQRLAVVEDAHLATIHAYFDEKRSDIRQFMENRWIPEFTARYLQSPSIQPVLREACASKPSSDCLHAMTIVVTNAQQQINAQYRQLLAPLNATEALVVEKLQAEYAQMQLANNAITRFLRSASDVEQARGELLAEVGIDQAAVRPVLLEIDEAIGALHTEIEDINTRIADYRQRLEDIRALIRGNSDETTNN